MRVSAAYIATFVPTLLIDPPAAVVCLPPCLPTVDVVVAPVIHAPIEPCGTLVIEAASILSLASREIRPFQRLPRNFAVGHLGPLRPQTTYNIQSFEDQI